MRLTLYMRFGNAAMQTGFDAGRALEEVADRLKHRMTEPTPGWGGIVRDVNGNTVGMWSIEEDE